MAEAEGFEPPWAFTQTVFKTAPLWPLRYTSIYISGDSGTRTHTVSLPTDFESVPSANSVHIPMINQ